MIATTTITGETMDPRVQRRVEYHEADVVVVGAGIFGCAAAYAMGQQGRSVLLLERSMKEPDRIVGELLQPGGIAALRKLGLSDCLEGIDAIPCQGMNVIYHGDAVRMTYPPLDENGQVTAASLNGQGKKQEGRAFHHGRFISNLRKACLRQPNVTVVETEAVNTIRGEHSDQILGVEARTLNPATGEKVPDYYFGQLTIIADGYASKFRKQYIPRTPIVKSKFYALELIDAPLPCPGYGHVIIGKAYPILMYQIGTHETRALIDVPDKIPEASTAAGGVRGYIRNTVVPTLPSELQASVLKALEDGKIPRSMPNSWLPPSQQTTNGLLILGDAMNMRHPLTGGGMTVAFNDVVILTDLLSPERVPNLGDPAKVLEAMHEFHWRRKSLTSIINVLAQALYSLFAANDRQLRALQLGCFGYFQRGVTEVPMGLLGGIIPRPLILAYHFFSVAFLALWINAMELMSGSALGFINAPLALIDAVLILWKASVVFLPVFYQEAL